MTKRQITLAARELGMIAVWNSEWQEWIVNYQTGDIRRTPDSSYHTCDGLDALATARQMSEWHPRNCDDWFGSVRIGVS